MDHPMDATQYGHILERLDQQDHILESVVRAVKGEPQEGNLGLVPRMDKAEHRIDRLYFLLPVSVAIGTGAGQFVARWLGV